MSTLRTAGDGCPTISSSPVDETECFGEELVVSTVGPRDGVIGTQHTCDRSHRPTLLPDAGVSGTVYETFGGQVQNVLFESADQHQLAEEPQQQRGRCGSPVLASNAEFDPLRGGLEVGTGRHDVPPASAVF